MWAGCGFVACDGTGLVARHGRRLVVYGGTKLWTRRQGLRCRYCVDTRRLDCCWLTAGWNIAARRGCEPPRMGWRQSGWLKMKWWA